MGYRPLDVDLLLRCKCGKVRSDSEKAAKRLRKKAAKIGGNQNAVRYYQCDFGSWHWTSMLEPPTNIITKGSQ